MVTEWRAECTVALVPGACWLGRWLCAEGAGVCGCVRVVLVVAAVAVVVWARHVDGDERRRAHMMTEG